MTSSIDISTYSKKSVLVRLLDLDKQKEWDKIMTSLGSTFVDSSGDPSWILPKNKLEQLEDMAKLAFRKKREDESSESSESSEESSDDEELIQKVLARRLTYESSQKSIPDETIPNSDDEDCVSYSRRLRHLYSVIKELRTRITVLENIKN